VDEGKEKSGRPYRAVVTGAAGFIGSHLVDALLERGHDVVGIDAFTPYYPPARKRANIAAAGANPKFDLLPADVTDLALDEVLRPADVVFHLAAQPGVRASWGQDFGIYVRHNIEATHRLLEAARRRQVRRLVFASSSSVYGDAPLPMAEDGPKQPLSPYGVTKLAAEQLCDVYVRSFGLEVVPLRFFTVYGPRQRTDMAFHQFVEAIMSGRPLTLYGHGQQRRDFTYVSDVVAVLLAAAERAQPGKALNVGGGSTVSVREAIAIMEGLIGKQAIIEQRPAPPGDARDTQASRERLSSLGVVPVVRIEDGLARQIAWHRESMHGVARLAAPRPVISQRRPAEPGHIVLYSHDTYGLGHLRRNTAIAHALLQRSPEQRITMITGSPVADQFPLPPGVSLVRLPSVVKVGPEEYRPTGPRSWSAVRAERAGIISSTLLRLRPDVFLVDHAPLGMKGELGLALQMAREELKHTRVILGLRDILDEPDRVRQAWTEQGVYPILEQAYDQVLVYGSRERFDAAGEYALPPSVATRTLFTGYIAKERGLEPPLSARDAWSRARRLGDRRVLATGGGGGDAAPMLLAAVEAWEKLRHLLFGQLLVVVGPLMSAADRAAVERRAAGTPSVDVIHSSKSMLSLIASADLVVTMGGYNSVVEAIAARKPLVICPRTAPRLEQLLRAEMIAGLGLGRVARLDENGAEGVADAMVAALKAGPPSSEQWRGIDLGGADRIAELMLDTRTSTLVEVAA
jgi:nucleoside-diphosphate-sugar epimerase/predicted glycosyltransferase